MSSINRFILVDNLRRLVPQAAPSSLPNLPPAAPIPQSVGAGLISAVSDKSAAGLALGAQSTAIFSSTDGVFTFSVAVREGIAGDGTTVRILVA